MPRPWCWVPSLVRLLGYHRVVGSSKLNSGRLIARKKRAEQDGVKCGQLGLEWQPEEDAVDYG